MQIARFGDKQQRGEDFLHDGAHGRKRQSCAAAHSLALNVRVDDRGERQQLRSMANATFELLEPRTKRYIRAVAVWSTTAPPYQTMGKDVLKSDHM